MKDKYPVCFAAKCKDNRIRECSQSGGMFTLLSDEILKKGGVIYGCKLDEKFIAIHGKALTKEERDKFCGSKYIQSDLNTVFRQVQIDLDEEKWVLFSGTTCQIAGLKAFLEKSSTEKLILVDIICHGVPSPLIWKEYLKWNEKKYDGRIVDVNFRNKLEFGWGCYVESLYLEEKQVNASYFSLLFHRHNILRPACYKCPYKNTNHPSDLTIGDCWGIEKVNPDFKDNMGISLVLINSEKGKLLFESVKEKCDLLQCNIQSILQQPLREPCQKPDEREKFWVDYRLRSFDKILRKYARFDWKVRVKRRIKKEIEFWIKIIRK